MTRREFPTRIKVVVIKRATIDNVVYCEACKSPTRRFQIDHINPDGLTGEPVIENAQLLCDGCYAVKNPQDTSAIAKAKRREAAHLNARTRPKIELKGAPFAKTQEAIERAKKPSKLDGLPPRRAMFMDVTPTKMARGNNG